MVVVELQIKLRASSILLVSRWIPPPGRQMLVDSVDSVEGRVS